MTGGPATGRAPRVLQALGVADAGVAEHVLQLSRGLRERGFEVEICAPQGWIVDEARGAGLAVHVLPFTRNPHPLADLRSLAGLVRLCRSLRPDVVHLHSAKAGLLGRIAARATGTPAVFTPNGWSFYAARGPVAALWHALERMGRLMGAATICVSEDERRDGAAARVLPRRVATIHNCVAVPPVPPPLPPAGAGPVFGSVARLSRQKGIDVLLRAFARVVVDEPRATLLIVGGGPLEAEMRALADRLGIDGRVRFQGAVPAARELLPGFDVFVLASRWEGLSIALLEARAAGRPCIATAVGGSDEVIAHGEDGLIVPPEDPGALAAAMRELARDPDLRRRMARLAHRRTLERFDLDRMVDRTAEVYRAQMRVPPRRGAGERAVAAQPG